MAIHEMSILGRSGDATITWDPTKRTEVKKARDEFDAFRAKGMATFKIARGGKQGEQIDAFDPKIKKILVIPAMQGGA